VPEVQADKRIQTKEFRRKNVRAANRMSLTMLFIPVALGAAAGLVCAAALTPWIGALLYGIGPLDAATFALAPLIILVASLAAIYGPASPLSARLARASSFRARMRSEKRFSWAAVTTRNRGRP
jgi:hypothetical protein